MRNFLNITQSAVRQQIKHLEDALGQLCKVVDLDGPVFLASDRPTTVEYKDGYIHCPAGLWGNRAGKPDPL